MKIKITQLFILFSIFSFAQVKNIKGKVTDLQNRGIENASVSLIDQNDDVVAFTFTDNIGNYSIDFNVNKITNIKINVSNMGYEKLSQIATNFSEPLNFVMKESSLTLEEVVVETEKKIRIVNDTTTIRVASFGNKTEQTIEDILKKLPGIEVLADGSIKAHGVAIDKLLIEGEDVFDKNYKILSKNLDANVLETVQILDNFEDNPILKKFSKSEKVALNLKLKKGLKNVWFGNATIGSGIVSENIWKESLNIGLLRKKIKLFYFGDYNNIGDKATDLMTSNINEKSSFSEDLFEYKAKSLFNISNNDVNIFSKSQGIFNKALLNSLSFTSKLKKNLTLRGLTVIANDEQIQNSTTFTQYNLQNNLISFSEENFYLNNKTSTSTELETTYTANEKNHFSNNLIFKNNPNKTTNNLLFNSDEINQELKNKNCTFYNHFNHSLQVSEKLLLNNYFYVGNDFNHEQANIKSPFLNQFLNVSNDAIINQNANNHLFYIGLKSKLISKIRNLDLSNSIQFEKNNEEFNNSFIVSNQNIQNYQNTTNLKIFNVFQDNTFRYNITKKLDITGNLNFQKSKFENNSLSISIFLINPSIYFNLKKTGFGNFSISYQENNTLPDINQLTTNFQLTDYRSFLQGTIYQKPLKNETVIFNYYLYNDPKRFSINTRFFYINTKSFINTSTDVTNDFVFNSNIQSAGSENYTFNFSFVNYMRKIKTASKIETNNSWIATPINVNSNVFLTSKNYINKIKYSATTYFNLPINFDFGFTYNYFQSTFQKTQTNNITKDAFLNITYKISKTILSEFNNTMYTINDNKYSFNNIVLSYSPTESKISYRLVLNNMMNENEFSQISLNNFSYYQSTVQIVPRYVLGTIKYRF